MKPEDSKNAHEEKPCRACTDFKTWAFINKKDMSELQANEIVQSPDRGQCPLDKDSLGRKTWAYLHTMAAYFPDNPTPTQQKEMSAFMKLFSKYYPCDHCAKDLQISINEHPPDTKTRKDFATWLCQMHNEVNRKLGKPEFDCRKIDERWRDGWEDGSCG